MAAAISHYGIGPTLINEAAFVHPFAFVTDSAIGARSKVWQFASVIRGAVIGEDCSVAAGAMVDGARVGDRTLVSHNVALHPGFIIGSDVFIGPNATLCNDAWPRAPKAGFAGFVPAIAYGDVEQQRKFATIIVEDGASIGAGAIILPGVVIKEGAMIAAGAWVNRNVPAKHLFTRDGGILEISDEIEKKRLEMRTRLASYL